MKITVSTTINAPIEKVWSAWTTPEDICNWNAATDEWHTPHATNDLRVNGTFSYRMEAKDGSMGFDLNGTYSAVEHHERIEHFFEDGREITTHFNSNGDTTEVTETFDAETMNPVELQQQGWQAILDNFKRYVEEK
jgi:uncharacterized protein YndB with AHSA1/START domain